MPPGALKASALKTRFPYALSAIFEAIFWPLKTHPNRSKCSSPGCGTPCGSPRLLLLARRARVESSGSPSIEQNKQANCMHDVFRCLPENAHVHGTLLRVAQTPAASATFSFAFGSLASQRALPGCLCAGLCCLACAAITRNHLLGEVQAIPHQASKPPVASAEYAKRKQFKNLHV